MGAGATPPGWYPDVERAGGERYWDGRSWTEHRRPARADPPTGFADDPFSSTGRGPTDPGRAEQPASPPFAAPSGGFRIQPAIPAGYQPYGTVQDLESGPRAGVALALSIVGLFALFCCLAGIPFGIAGTVLGRMEMQAIDRGQRAPHNRGTAKAAFVVGIIVTGLGLVLALAWAVVIAVAS